MPRASPAYRLSLLGAFRIEKNSRSIRFPTRKSESLLAYLALYPEEHSREKISALFWGDTTDEQARHSLRTALLTVRKELGDDIIIASRETIQLNPDLPLWVDVREIFDCRSLIADPSPAQIENLRSKIEHYRGDLLPDCYDDWILSKREQLHELALNILFALVQTLRSASQYERASEYARRILTLDPANEKAHQHLIFCAIAMGDRTGALIQYAECVHSLRDELGVEPSKETIALYERIQAQSIGARSREALLTNLPHPLTSFVGRASETNAIHQTLLDSRLVTLMGAGGCGKTRLALSVASDFAAENHFKNGVWWVDLAPLTDSSRVPHAVATVFHLAESPSNPITTTLADHLREKEILLVLDNCEHLYDSCAHLTDTLLTTCPQLRILATSRTALGIAGELTWRVPSLALPDTEHLPAPTEIVQYDAVRLFVERAAMVAPKWESVEHTSPVAHICKRLDGMPLAIELAAARLKVLSAEQIATRLDDRFALLTSGSSAALPRHQTLRAAVDWSFDLLADEERILFRRVSVFAGGFSLEAVESVCGKDILDLLTALVDKSLVLVEQQDSQARYRMLETIRQYAREKLLESDETAHIQSQHLVYYLQFAQQAQSELSGAEQLTWLKRLEAERDNFRAALDWALGLEASEADLAAGLHLATALGGFWQRRNYWKEGREWIERAIRVTQGIGSPQTRINALKHAYHFANAMGDLNVVRAYLQEREKLLFALNDELEIADLILHRARLARLEHNLDAAQSFADDAYHRYMHLANSSGIAAVLSVQGLIKRNLGDAEAARAYFDESLRLRQEIGETETLAESLGMSASAAFRAGDFVTARARLEQLLVLAKEQDDKSLMRHALINLGEVLRAMGNYSDAKPHYENSLTLARELPARLHIGCAMQGLGYIAVQEDNWQRARECFLECLTLYQEQQLKWGIAVAIEGFARLVAAQGEPERAARLLGAIDTHLALTGPMATIADRLEHERTLTAVHTLLDDATFADAWQAGSAMTLEQAIADIRELKI